SPAPRFFLRLLAGLLVYTAFLFALRLGGPPNLTDNDQERPASYVLDALVHGQWIVQRDWTGDITSKPPAYTWLAALASLLLGGPSLGALYLPCALALFGTAALVAWIASRYLGHRAALISCAFLLANPLSAKLVALARTDPLFTFTVTLTAVLAFQAWKTGSGWTLAWLAAAFATLTKGPLGLVLGFAGLFAWFWERRQGARSPFARGHVPGFLLWIALCGGWFGLAWLSAGDALVRKMLGAELVQHALGEPGAFPGTGLVLAPAYFLSRFIPWSLLSVAGLWMAIQRPESDPSSRQLQRFAASWLVVGLAVFGLAGHQRGDLIAPLMPAGALLAAIPAARWTAAWTWPRLVATCALVALAIGCGAQFQHTHRNTPIFQESTALSVLPSHFIRLGGNPGRLRPTDSPYALQFHFGTHHPPLSWEAAARHLRESPENSVAVVDRPALEQALGPDALRLRPLVSWPSAQGATGEVVRLEASGDVP
ncbi:MAG: ArnT family glycosyltransferase, partial [Limisphaerales bacterium]